jgi:hypothetical protein
LSPLLFCILVNSASSVLQHAKLLIFADDMKLYLNIRSINDCLRLQADLNRLVDWGNSVGLQLNVSKCRSMSFYRCLGITHFPYSIHNTPIQFPGNSIRDLGFKLTHNLCPRLHIEEVSCKAIKILGFIQRVSREFKLIRSYKNTILLSS